MTLPRRIPGLIATLMAAAALSACSTVPGTGPATSAATSASAIANTPHLAPFFDCIRTRGETLVSAHRAGPAVGYPENAIETALATLAHNPAAMLEIDVQQSADGTLFLLHDDMLDRTTTGTGPAAARTFADLSALRLKDDAGTVTDFRVPPLTAALAMAVERDAIVQLDVKRGVPFDRVVAAVRRAGAVRHAIIITYNDADAATVAGLAPDLMVSVGIRSAADAARLVALSVKAEQMLAWTGTRAPDTALFANLRAAGVEPMFGTLGRPGQRLDDVWLADGDPSEFRQLARDGAVVIGTDWPRIVADALPRPTCRIGR